MLQHAHGGTRPSKLPAVEVSPWQTCKGAHARQDLAGTKLSVCMHAWHPACIGHAWDQSTVMHASDGGHESAHLHLVHIEPSSFGTVLGNGAQQQRDPVLKVRQLAAVHQQRHVVHEEHGSLHHRRPAQRIVAAQAQTQACGWQVCVWQLWMAVVDGRSVDGTYIPPVVRRTAVQPARCQGDAMHHNAAQAAASQMACNLSMPPSYHVKHTCMPM